MRSTPRPVAAQRAARTALQVHAGIGYTFEHDLHMWMKRTWTLTSLWGDDGMAPQPRRASGDGDLDVHGAEGSDANNVRSRGVGK